MIHKKTMAALRNHKRNDNVQLMLLSYVVVASIDVHRAPTMERDFEDGK